MMSGRRGMWWMVCTLAVTCVTGGCTGTVTAGADSGAEAVDTGPSNSADTSSAADANSSDDTAGGGERSIDSLSLEPASATLTSRDGSRPTQDFDLVVTYTDGRAEDYTGPVEYKVDDRHIGTVDTSTGKFKASGIAGGSGRISASVPNRPSLGGAEAEVTVEVSYRIEGSGLPGDFESKFSAPTSSAEHAPEILYPLDGAVMPQNVYPADIQWSRGQRGDLFRVRLSKPDIQVTAYLAHTGPDFGNHWLVDQKAWRAMARTHPEEATTVEVVRYVASLDAAVRSPATPKIRFATGSLTGSVYYWDISAVRIKRIDDGSGKADSFMPNPPKSRNDGQNCVGCHSVSNSGRYMVGRLGPGDNIGTVFDLTKDLSKKPVPTEFALRDDGPRWWFSTWNPDDTRLMVTQGPGNKQGLSLMDPFTGKIVEPKAGSLPSSGTSHPAWAPDDSLVAYVTNSQNWGGELDRGDIAAIPVTGKDEFGTPTTLLKADSLPNPHPAGDTTSYPTWSPDSQWLVFAHGSGARSQDDTSALYMMTREGTQVVRLDNANGGPKTEDTFQPNFSPFETGEYFWLSYLSKRPYGNKAAGTRGGEELQQIWVSAIRKDPQPGQDPSQVGFWLPGQSTEARNISAFWAPRACRDKGASCTVDSECCGGECVEGEDGKLTCSPPENVCRQLNETCTSDEDCCRPWATRCSGRVCVPSGG